MNRLLNTITAVGCILAAFGVTMIFLEFGTSPVLPHCDDTCPCYTAHEKALGKALGKALLIELDKKGRDE